ncbi:YaeF family permuted papain-like enzyme [Providencia vermicola]|uniref:YaeF family permuted papain-like enzyme n=2 Tax=Providencia TaxID=586 RepID=A0AAI9I3F1_PROST|nr:MULTISPECIES: YaeF family permuted papain-like enzyme [Providencia]ELR5045458.1 YaeF family permuted papain-like enzyme [Providencia rettgeri]ELR5037578.1 YaeF family permuted papain-like enzyme [Providencia stuartii]ELR5120155.1 YaeF family permuted papain-like enzyme [Providencia stuartii]ELR5143558.1 YaeF family permuted papain-like enzyme [Providencia stuartii]ELR5292243.1 YaeF family permuted papain-like enzyme [Providencia stuartii]
MINFKYLFCYFCLIIVTGCSTGFKKDEESNRLKFSIQQPNTIPIKESVEVLAVSDMLPGDILLSSATGLNSWGIRLFSISGVSHASIYLGAGEVAESVGSGVRIISLDQAIADSNNMVVLRQAGLTSIHADKLREFSMQNDGSKYNYKGIVMIAPWMLTKRVCELPFIGQTIRNFCLKTLATVQLGDDVDQANGFFCSQFVLDAYKYAGLPLFEGNSAWITPADILHMRTGDVPTFVPTQRLSYVGHLKSWSFSSAISRK